MTTFTTHSAGQVIASADINLIQTAVNALENKRVALNLRNTAAVSTVDPLNTMTNVSMGTATMLAYFWATASFTSTQVRIIIQTTGGTGSIGLYTVDASDNATRVAVVTSAAYNATGAKTFSWDASVAITAGNRYCLGVTPSGTPPTIMAVGSLSANQQIECGTLPRMNGQLASGTVPTSFVAATPTNLSVIPYAVIL